jgi:predicted nucleic acid-binding protein
MPLNRTEFMKILLDTNIIIHREASTVINKDIGLLFYWLDNLHYTKCIHPLTAEELARHSDKNIVKTLKIKLGNYYILKTLAPLNEEIKKVSQLIDKSDNDLNDTKLLNEVICNRVDYLISEDKKIHLKAAKLGIDERVFHIDTFIEKVTCENPDLIDYRVLSVKKKHFGNIDLSDSFFNSFKEDYTGFDKWFNKKADEPVYVCYNEDTLSAFLYLKLENETEDYSNIEPAFKKKKRLKVGTFKIILGTKLAERFLYIIFDNARLHKVDEIYITIFNKTVAHAMLIAFLEEWGFIYYGIKKTSSGEEEVYVRDFKIDFDADNPKRTYPWLSRKSDIFIVPIRPEYHTELFPDSILKTESPFDFVENEPHRNAISKVYISHSFNRDLKKGDIIVFYRSGGIYKGVATTIGIVENIVTEIKDEKELYKICYNRTVLSKDELDAYWHWRPNNRPFIINFLYAFSFKKRMNLKNMLDEGILPSMDSVRTINQINRERFTKLINLSGL